MCRFDEFTCDDGQTCIAWEKICDGQDDCPQHENGPGGEDEVLGKSNLLVIADSVQSEYCPTFHCSCIRSSQA